MNCGSATAVISPIVQSQSVASDAKVYFRERGADAPFELSVSQATDILLHGSGRGLFIESAFTGF